MNAHALSVRRGRRRRCARHLRGCGRGLRWHGSGYGYGSKRRRTVEHNYVFDACSDGAAVARRWGEFRHLHRFYRCRDERVGEIARKPRHLDRRLYGTRRVEDDLQRYLCLQSGGIRRHGCNDVGDRFRRYELCRGQPRKKKDDAQRDPACPVCGSGTQRRSHLRASLERGQHEIDARRTSLKRRPGDRPERATLTSTTTVRHLGREHRCRPTHWT